MSLCVCVCVCVCEDLYLFVKCYVYIFVDLVKCGVLTLAGEILCYRNYLIIILCAILPFVKLCVSHTESSSDLVQHEVSKFLTLLTLQ